MSMASARLIISCFSRARPQRSQNLCGRPTQQSMHSWNHGEATLKKNEFLFQKKQGRTRGRSNESLPPPITTPPFRHTRVYIGTSVSAL